MEQRREPRFEINQELYVTLLGETETVVTMKIVNVSGKGMGLECASPLPPGSAIKIELPDTLLLGEVAHCRRDKSGYKVGIALEQALYHTRGLAALADRLLGETSGKRADAAVKRYYEDS